MVECRLWFHKQQEGNFIKHLMDTFQVLKQPEFMRGAEIFTFQWQGHCKPGETRFEEDERMAALFGIQQASALPLRFLRDSSFTLGCAVQPWQQPGRQISHFVRSMAVLCDIQESVWIGQVAAGVS